MTTMDNEIFESLYDIVTFFNQPQQDRYLLDKAAVHLEPAALPIVVRVGKTPGISIGELADQVGRNHSSVSRQVDRLMGAGWLREAPRNDQRVRRLLLTEAGQRGLMQIKVARETEFSRRLADYTPTEREDLNRVLRRLADTLGTVSREQP